MPQYQFVLPESGSTPIEFEAVSLSAALSYAEITRLAEARVLADGAAVCSIRRDESEFWVLTPVVIPSALERPKASAA